MTLAWGWDNTVSYVPQASLELTYEAQNPLNSWSSCLHFLSAGIMPAHLQLDPDF